MPNLESVSVEISSAERELLEAAAKESHTSLGEFMRRKALAAAEMEILDRRGVKIPVEHWHEFVAWINRPAEDLPELRRLMSMRPVWED